MQQKDSQCLPLETPHQEPHLLDMCFLSIVAITVIYTVLENQLLSPVLAGYAYDKTHLTYVLLSLLFQEIGITFNKKTADLVTTQQTGHMLSNQYNICLTNVKVV